jgi:hypothetical protein
MVLQEIFGVKSAFKRSGLERDHRTEPGLV